MKTILTFLLAAAAIAPAAFSQITLTADDVAFLGLQLSNVQDTLPDASIKAGPGGQNQTWNFSALHSHEVFSFETLHAAETPYAQEFPSATIAAIENGDTYGYFEKDANSLRFLGYYGNYEYEPGIQTELGIHATPYQSILRFPTTFNDGFTETYQRTIALSGDEVGQQFDSLRIVSTVLRSVSYDAYGTLTTPAGSFPVLRVKEIETSADTVYFLFMGVWAALPGEEPVTDITYNFWTKQGGIGFPVATIQADASGQTISASWVKDAVSPTKETTVKINLELFPNPAARQLNVELTENFNGQLEVYDCGSRLVASKKVGSHLEQLNVEALRPGSYVLVARDGRNRLAGYKQFEIAR